MGGGRRARDGAAAAAGRSRRGAEEPPVRVSRLGAQPGALGRRRRLLVRIQALVREPPGADAGRRTAPVQVHPDRLVRDERRSKCARFDG